MFGSNLTNAYAAIEFACLDIQGKAIGRPVSDLLGGRLGIGCPSALTSSTLRPAAIRPGRAAASASSTTPPAWWRSTSWRSMKIKGGVHPPDQEVETFIALRKRFPDIPIRIDPNSVWSGGHVGAHRSAPGGVRHRVPGRPHVGPGGHGPRQEDGALRAPGLEHGLLRLRGHRAGRAAGIGGRGAGRPALVRRLARPPRPWPPSWRPSAWTWGCIPGRSAAFPWPPCCT